MKWLIPAKTFLIGEYLALHGGPAILLNTQPCFEMSLSVNNKLVGIDANSPAAKLWHENKNLGIGLNWFDPYQGIGGLGASSAQFLGAYYASNKEITREAILQTYLHFAWSGQGMAPSGYDVISQSMSGIVYLHVKKNIYKTYNWPFSDVNFILVHTGKKQATHTYLQNLEEIAINDELFNIVNSAKTAFLQKNSIILAQAINDYHAELHKLNLVAKHSLEMIDYLKSKKGILAVKGCGALGADVLFILVNTIDFNKKISEINALGWRVLATDKDIYLKKMQKTLDV